MYWDISTFYLSAFWHRPVVSDKLTHIFHLRHTKFHVEGTICAKNFAILNEAPLSRQQLAPATVRFSVETLKAWLRKGKIAKQYDMPGKILVTVKWAFKGMYACFSGLSVSTIHNVKKKGIWKVWNESESVKFKSGRIIGVKALLRTEKLSVFRIVFVSQKAFPFCAFHNLFY